MVAVCRACVPKFHDDHVFFSNPHKYLFSFLLVFSHYRHIFWVVHRLSPTKQLVIYTPIVFFSPSSMAIDVAAPTLSSTATQLGLDKDRIPRPILNRLLRHDLVTSDFDELKFQAAASRQLQLGDGDTQYDSSDIDSRLIASPYNGSPHLLDLNSLDTQSRLLSLALAYFTPIRDDYATAEYLDSFNWAEVFDLLKLFSEAEGHSWMKQTFYVVSFRSTLHPGVDNDHLHDLDAYSHQEATTSGGLLKYWFGTKNEKRQNLATCT